MIYFHIPTFPPSSNAAYANIRGTNKRVLTTEGRAYKTATIAHIARNYPLSVRTIEKDVGYYVVVRFWFESICNSGWPEKAQSRFKKQDVGNRLKLLEDSLKDACGIDDSQHLGVFIEKVPCCPGEKPFTEVWMWHQNEESPIADLIKKLDTF